MMFSEFSYIYSSISKERKYQELVLEQRGHPDNEKHAYFLSFVMFQNPIFRSRALTAHW